VGNSSRERLIGPLALLGAISLWGFVPTATRYLLESFSPAQILLLRFGFGSAAIVAVLFVLRPAMPTRATLPAAIALGTFATMGFNVPVAFGIEHVEAGTAALLIGTQPVFITILAALRLDERLTRSMVAGTVLALAGSAVIALTADTGFQLTGSYVFSCLLILSGSFAWGVYSILAKPRLGPDLPASSVAMIGVLCAFPLVTPFGATGFLDGLGELSAVGWLAAIFVSIGANVSAPVLWNVGLQRGQASRAGLYLYLVPIIGVSASVILLGETLSGSHIIGGSLVIIGVILATFPMSRLRLSPRPKPVAKAVNDAQGSTKIGD
jgi:drug/metabolite transporter (DMT)-like permease